MAMFFLAGGGIHSRRHFLRGILAGGSLVCSPCAWGAGAHGLDIAAVAHQVLATRPGYRSGDLISQGDASAVLDELARRGLQFSQRDEILRMLLEDGHYLVRQLRTAAGLKFMRGTAHQPLAFDRLDRLSSMPGGQQLIHDIIRLPDGQQLMAKKPTPGFTDLTTLLPKQANGKTPVNKEFNKPTGKLYTEAALVETLQKAAVK